MTPHIALAILHSLGLTQKKLREIPLENSIDFLMNVDMNSLLQIGHNQEQASRIVDKKTQKLVEHVQCTIRDQGVHIVHIDDREYPELLRSITNAPTLLYVRGTLHATDALLSIVGSRRHSDYAESSLAKIIPGLITASYGIVSGGAQGIDSVAHSLALRHGGHTTVVFWAGIDVHYPPHNTPLFEKVVTQWGALVSQFPIGTLAEPYNFPIRNEIVAAMSRGTLIAEAWADSGTLITARLAVEANRDVYVIPADITRLWAVGSNALIRDGLGKLITSAQDILCEYQIVDRQLSLLSSKPAFLDPLQEKIYDILCRDSLTIDILAEKVGIDVQIVINTLAMMEIEGILTASRGMYRVV